MDLHIVIQLYIKKGLLCFFAEKEMFTDTSSLDIEQTGLITDSVNYYVVIWGLVRAIICSRRHQQTAFSDAFFSWCFKG